MSQTKVTDALRNVTAVDGTKIDAVDGAKITTGTIPEARITSLDSTKLTGNIANARIPASAVTQHVTGYNDASIRADILKLALHQAIDGNRAAYNLEDSFVDGFEDDTGITTETTVDRDTTSEYVSSIYTANVVTTPTSASDWNGNTATYAFTSGGVDATSGDRSVYTDWVSGTGDFEIDFTLTDYDYGGNIGVFAVSEVGTFSGGTSNSMTGMTNSFHHREYHQTFWKGGSAISAVTIADGSVCKIKRVSGTLSFVDDGVTVYTWSGTNNDSLHFHVGTDGSPYSIDIDGLTLTTVSSTTNATGTLISDPQTASTSRTSASGVIIYEDAVGTNTLGTDLKIYFTANNGTNWTEAASYGTATTYSGTKKLVKLGATTVSAGSAIAMKAVWANQSSSSGTTKTVTAIDGAHHDNVQAKIGSTSIFCDGTNDAIEVADSADFAFAGDYTVEFWVYFNGAPANNEHICGQGGNTAGTYAFMCRSEGSGNFIFGTSNGSTQRIITAGVNIASQWAHVAMVKYGTSQKLYVNGTQAGSTLTHSEAVQNVSAPWEFGGGNASASHISAWWEEIRFSNVARYTGNFTAFGQNGGTVASPTAFTTDANTVLLIHSEGSNGSTTMADSSAIAGKEARLHGWAVNY